MLRFNCDYLEGCHPAVLEALTRTNLEQTAGYGVDPFCEEAAALIRARFGLQDAPVHFMVGGTQANVTVIASLLRPFEGAVCATTGHIHVHETGALEATGHKCLTLDGGPLGKLTGAQVEECVRLQADFEHTVRPGCVYISMSTEVGTVYSLDELRSLYASCKKCGLPLFVDGARLAYGLEAEGCDITPADLAANCDVFTVGGTKCGLLFGEAVVFSTAALGERFRYMMKRQGGMLAKGRLLGVQFGAIMKDDLYFSAARKANAQALRIRDTLREKGIPFSVESPTNQQFPIFTDAQAAVLSENFALEDEGRTEDGRRIMRICTSWCTRDDAVDALVAAIRAL